MKTSLMDKDLKKENYAEYIEKIINIFRLSSSHSSILFDLKIKDYQAYVCLSIVNQEGQKEEFQDVIMQCDDDFYHSFLIPLVENVYRTVSIEVKDIVNLASTGLVTFRMVTKYNDLFTVDGLSEDDANSLLQRLVKMDSPDVTQKIISNSGGVGSTWSFLLVLGILAIVFILFLVIIG